MKLALCFLLCVSASGFGLGTRPRGARVGTVAGLDLGDALMGWPRQRWTSLDAKKKTGKALVSADFLSSIEELDIPAEAAPAPVSTSMAEEGVGETRRQSDKKGKKRKKLAIDMSDDVLNSFGDDDDGGGSVAADAVAAPLGMEGVEADAEDGDTSSMKKKKKKKKKEFDWGASFDPPGVADAEAGAGAGADTASSSSAAAGAVAPSKAHRTISAVAEREDEEEEEDDDDDDDEKKCSMQEQDGEETIEAKVRKRKPPSRVRFAESAKEDYVMMGLDGVGLMYGNTVVIQDGTFQVQTGERVGLVGPNGGGKTTMLRILAGDLEPTYGDVVKSSKNVRVAFLRQEFTDELVPTRTLRKELFAAFHDELQVLEDIKRCEDAVARTTDDPALMETTLNELQDLQDKAITQGVYSLGSKVEKIMDAMGFDAEAGEQLVERFSGGWKMRIGIAKILLLAPSIVLLDEPTNHLDLDSVFWLEDFLRSQDIPMVIVSHDREFLDQVCNKIVDVSEGSTSSYDGNYSKFLLEKENRLSVWRDKFEKQQKYEREEEKWLRKNRNKEEFAQQVRNREVALAKYRAADGYVAQPPKDRRFRFRFPPVPRCGQSVVEAQGLGHGYGSGKYQTLFKDVDIQVDRGMRVGFIGPNGSGKSTMMKIIQGLESPREGWCEFGSANVVQTYFQQDQADAFDLEGTVLETVLKDAPTTTSLTDIRALLGQFMFKGDDVNKKLRVLSGGEKARVALAKMMLTSANLLLLDEPTNHLDITAKEVLEDALVNYEGSVLCISHDRYFMSQIANTIFSFGDKSMVKHDCDYHDFMCGEEAPESLKTKVESRYVYGDKFRIAPAKEVVLKQDKDKKKKNFGGSGAPCGNLNKGIKNAKRFK